MQLVVNGHGGEEQFVVPFCPMVAAIQSLALAPAATADNKQLCVRALRYGKCGFGGYPDIRQTAIVPVSIPVAAPLDHDTHPRFSVGDAWKKIVPGNERDVFARLRDALDDRGELRLTIPMLYIEAQA